MISRMVLWGATGQSLVLRECMSHRATELVALFDNDERARSPFPDVPIHHGWSGFESWLATIAVPSSLGFLVAIGGAHGHDRLEIQTRLEESGLRTLVAQHPTAFVASSAVLGPGSQVLAQAAVCVGVRLGRAVIVNTAASLDHECVVGDGVHVAPGARIAGCVTLEDFAFVGTGAVILPRVRIGTGAVVGAGAVVRKDVGPSEVVVGNPARVLRAKTAHRTG